MRWAALAQTWRNVRASYWFVPTVMMIGAIVLSQVTGYLDHVLGPEWLSSLDFAVDNRPEGARSVLSVIASSMITVAGVTFSMTMVSVSFAAGQFGPRLIGNFMRDQGNQMTLGVFIATFVYCLMVLRTVRNGEVGPGAESVSAFVPHFSLLVALALALSCVGVLIYFIHHVPETINVGRITAELGRQLNHELADLFPRSDGRDAEPDALDRQRDRAEFSSEFWSEAFPLDSRTNGYIQAIDLDALTLHAVDRELMIRLEYRPGDFANVGDPLLKLHPADGCDEARCEEIRSHIIFGRERTPTQNALFLADELIEILARALSPGVNDPYTALNCINWLGSALAQIAENDPTPAHRYDEDGQLRIVVHPISFARFADVVCASSRQYVASDRNACLAMLRVTAEAAARAAEFERRELLVEHAARLNDAAQELLPLRSDREEVARRLEDTRRLVSDSAARERLRDSEGWLGGTA